VDGACLPLFVWTSRAKWFSGDEWNFLAVRSAGNLSSLFRPYNEHWSTLPILYFRLLWNLVGLHSYLPYLASVVVLHLTIAALLRAVMRRGGASPWVATISALIFSLFGAGYFNIEFAFQIGFDGSVLFGLAYLLLVDHAGRPDRRDAVGLIAGLASLMCSGVGVTMVLVVALAVSMRHGLRRALLHAGPLAAAFLLWFVLIGHGGYARWASPWDVAQFTVKGLAATFGAIGHLQGVGLALALLLLIGTAVVCRSYDLDELRARCSVPAAMLAGSVVFLVVTGVGRGVSQPGTIATQSYAASRYLYVAAAMILPALSIAATVLVDRWRLLVPVVFALLVVGVPGNFALLNRPGDSSASYRDFVLGLPRIPIANQVPRSIHPDPFYDPSVTIGWLVAGVRSGRIPPPGKPYSASETASMTLALAWQPTRASSAGSCVRLSLPATVQADKGATITFKRAITVAYSFGANMETTPRELSGSSQQTTFKTYWPMVTAFGSSYQGQVAVLCEMPATG
jgi:hypothetical protein